MLGRRSPALVDLEALASDSDSDRDYAEPVCEPKSLPTDLEPVMFDADALDSFEQVRGKMHATAEYARLQQLEKDVLGDLAIVRWRLRNALLPPEEQTMLCGLRDRLGDTLSGVQLRLAHLCS